MTRFRRLRWLPVTRKRRRPFLLMIGLDDDVIYASSVARLADAIRAGGGSVTVKAYPGVGHIGLMLGFCRAVRRQVATPRTTWPGLPASKLPASAWSPHTGRKQQSRGAESRGIGGDRKCKRPAPAAAQGGRVEQASRPGPRLPRPARQRPTRSRSNPPISKIPPKSQDSSRPCRSRQRLRTGLQRRSATDRTACAARRRAAPRRRPRSACRAGTQALCVMLRQHCALRDQVALQRHPSLPPSWHHHAVLPPSTGNNMPVT